MPKAYSDNPIGSTLTLTAAVLAGANAHAILQQAGANSTVLDHVGGLSDKQKQLLYGLLKARPPKSTVAFKRRSFTDPLEARDAIVSYTVDDVSSKLTVTFA